MSEVTISEARFLKEELEATLTKLIHSKCTEFTTITGMPVESVVTVTNYNGALNNTRVTLDFKI